MTMKAFALAWTLALTSLIFALFAITNKNFAVAIMPMYLLVSAALLAAHHYYSRKGPDKHGRA